MTLIRRDAEGARRILDDPFVEVADEAEIPDGPAVISGARWLASAADGSLAGRAAPLGIRVLGDADAEALGPTLAPLALVEIELPKFTDGRAYTLARLLRERHGYQGELRAVGHVLRDQLFYLARCGFDSFVLTEGKDADDAIAAFADFSVTYQPAADHQVPIWRRRREG